MSNYLYLGVQNVDGLQRVSSRSDQSVVGNNESDIREEDSRVSLIGSLTTIFFPEYPL